MAAKADTVVRRSIEISSARWRSDRPPTVFDGEMRQT
jgi:hypothetical protein